MSGMHVYTGMFTDVLMTFMFSFIPGVSCCLFCYWLLWDSQDVMFQSRASLYMMGTLYWCILAGCIVTTVIALSHLCLVLTSMFMISDDANFSQEVVAVEFF